LDAKLKQTLQAKEYQDVISEVSKKADTEREKQTEVHARKLARDREIGNNYVSWIPCARLKQRRKRRVHRHKVKVARISSRKYARRK
jgi:hypothetical protein